MDGTTEHSATGDLALVPGTTILLVEDCRVSAQSIRLMARACNIRVRHATSIAAARKHLAIFRPSAVVIDLGMPDGSGCQLIREIVGDSAARPAILAISGAADGRDESLAAGADAFCAKPFVTAERLHEVIMSILPACSIKRPSAPVRIDTARDELIQQDLLRVQTELRDAIPSKDPEKLQYCAQFIHGLGAELADDDLQLAGLALVEQLNEPKPEVEPAAESAAFALDLCLQRLGVRSA